MLTDIAAGAGLLVAALTAFGVMFRRLRASFRAVEDLSALLAMTEGLRDLVERELNHNHGSSLKDDVHGIALGVQRAHNRVDQVVGVVEELQADVEQIKQLLTAHLQEQTA